MKKIYFILFLILFLGLNFSKAQSSFNININWQSINSYIPPFYEGKALPGEGEDIKAVAELSGDIDPKNLFFVWYYNDFYLYKYSKYGGDVVYFSLDQFKNVNTLKVQIYSDNTQSTLLGEKTIEIKPYKSLAIFYKKNINSILTYANAINKKYESFKVFSGDNFDILTEPFYFSVKNPNDKNLLYEWMENNISGNISYSNILNYIYKSISDNISLKITNLDKNKNLQEANTLLNFK